jgi:hypothetical protein
MDKDKRQGIIHLELFTRSNPLYQNFEERTKDLNEVEISYLFCKECEARAKNLNFIKEWQEVRDMSIEDKENYPLIYNKEFEKLKVIDIDFYSYYNNLMEKVILQPLTDSINKKYSVTTMIDEPILLKVLGKKRVDELLYDGLPKEIQENKGFPYLDFEHFLTLLEKEEALKIKKHIKLNPFGFRTMILRDYTKIKRDLASSYFVEIDFTKPIEEIKQFIETIKEDFEDDPKQIPNMYDLLKIKRKKIEFYTLKSEIYRSTNKKKNNQLLADILFIYDCYKANYEQADIQLEFKYHYGYGIKKSTIKSYLEFAKTYINQKKYLEFLNP